MKLKQLLFSAIIITIFITGCSSNKISNTNEVKSEAIYQKTMTKVQNNVNEIMNKDYEYVLSNMGEPYCTTYYINLSKITSTEIFEANFKATNMRLIYPKNTDKIQTEESAIYIDIKDNIVSDVQIYELSDLDKEENKNVDMVINKYNNEEIYLITDTNDDLDNYIGHDKEEIKNIVGESSPNYKIYDKRKDAQISIYLIKDTDKQKDKVLATCIQENKIKNIKIVSSNNVNIIKKYLCE